MKNLVLQDFSWRQDASELLFWLLETLHVGNRVKTP